MKKIMILLLGIILLTSNVFATVITPTPGGDVDSGTVGIAETILGYIQFLAFSVAVGMVLVIGIKYMSSGAMGVAKVKDTLLPYIIGAILVGSASAIVELIAGMV